MATAWCVLLVDELCKRDCVCDTNEYEYVCQACEQCDVVWRYLMIVRQQWWALQLAGNIGPRLGHGRCRKTATY